MLHRHALRLLCLGLFVVAGTPLIAQQTILPIVNEVFANSAGTQIVTTGQGFGTAPAKVSIAGAKLTVIATNDISITVQPPNGIQPGTYLPVPTACTGAATSTVVDKNLVATGMTCSVTTNNSAGCSDTTHTFAVKAGDSLSLAYHETNLNPFMKLTSTLICQYFK